MPDGSKQLSEGMVIETSLLARLVGFKLLTLEGSVFVSPAYMRELDPSAEATRALAGKQGRANTQSDDARPQPLPLPARPVESDPQRRVGTRLGMAERLLSESATELRDLAG